MQVEGWRSPPTHPHPPTPTHPAMQWATIRTPATTLPARPTRRCLHGPCARRASTWGGTWWGRGRCCRCACVRGKGGSMQQRQHGRAALQPSQRGSLPSPAHQGMRRAVDILYNATQDQACYRLELTGGCCVGGGGWGAGGRPAWEAQGGRRGGFAWRAPSHSALAPPPSNSPQARQGAPAWTPTSTSGAPLALPRSFLSSRPGDHPPTCSGTRVPSTRWGQGRSGGGARVGGPGF